MQDCAACKVPFYAGAKPKLFLLKKENRKTLLVMKITAILLLVASLQVSAKGWGQEKISLSLSNVSLSEAFSSITSQAGISFFYRPQYVKGKTITINVSNADLKTVFDLCVKDQELRYEIVGKTVAIRPVKISTNNNEVQIDKSVASPPVELKGRIANNKGEPLAGANITIKRTGKGTISDANGNFILNDVNGDDIIVISYVGYQAQSIKIGDRNIISLVLVEANNELDQVVMQAYGQTTRRFNTGNIAKVTSEEIGKQPVINPLQALQGRVPGLVITQSNGYSSAPFKVELRGRNTINSLFTSEPLYIIDGVPLTVLEVANSQNYTSGSPGFIQNGLKGPANGQSPLFSLNPNDIESIEVLKDADATAIYGSRAANGVILITTKKGKIGKSKFNINVTQGIKKITRYWDMLNTQQFVEMRKEAFKNDNLNMTAGNAAEILVWDTTRYTNWQKEIWGGLGANTNIQVGVAGGDARTTFRIGGGYTRTSNILSFSGKDERSSVSFNLNHKTGNQKLGISLTSIYSFAQTDMINMPANAAVLPPNAPAIYDSVGNLNYNGWNPLQTIFPFSVLRQPYNSKTNFLNSNLTLTYSIFKGLTLRSSFGYNTVQVTQQYLQTIASQNPSDLPTGTAQFGNNNNRNWVIEPQVEYSKIVGSGKINILIGGTAQKGITGGLLVRGQGYTNDALIKTISNAPIKDASENFGEYRYSALFSRINYSWRERYILNLTGRRDGSSNFGPGSQFNNFGSIGVAWIFTDEKWIASNLKFLSFGKLRSSYGTTGGEGPAYGYLTRWASQTGTYSSVTPLQPTQHANPNYRWQVNRKLETALELGLFQDRITLISVYYQNRCNNQIVSFPLGTFTGFSTVVANSPANVLNEGWEFTSGIKILNKNTISWSVGFNIGINKNKLLSYPNIELSPYNNILKVGKPLNITQLLHYTGVDPTTGQYTFEDKNKDSKINTNINSPDNDFYIYDLSPKYSGGINSTFNYKTFQLSFNFSFVKSIGRNALADLFPGIRRRNMPTLVLSRWKKAGDETNIARFTTSIGVSDQNFASLSDGIYSDASFLRLQNAFLSYGLPRNLIEKIRVSACNIFVQAQNLFVITSYKGLDPETQNFGDMPPAKIVTVGINFNF